ncbi:MAG: ABC transporter permease [Bacteroidota bacterium]
MRIPLTYTLRSLLTRRLTSALTAMGIALVVFVFAAVLMLSDGITKTLVATGDERNVIMIRKGSDSELISGLDRDLVNTVRSLPAFATGPGGKPLVSAEVVTIINMEKLASGDMGNINVRGVGPEVSGIRPGVRLTAGRWFRAGSREIAVGASVHTRFQGADIGRAVRFSGDAWRIVGVFASDGNGFESEIWGDAEELLGALNRPGVFSSVTARLRDPGSLAELEGLLESDNRLRTLRLEREKDYYERQSSFMAIFIRVLGLVITFGFSAGAVIGAMITMYAAVSHRTVEIGTLRALGFPRRSILAAFLVESSLLALVGGGAGLLLASGLQMFTISTVNFGTFAELAFGFSLTPFAAAASLAFALTMGLLGGVLPAARAARLDILTALRAS